jgi:DNA-binding winged helix-turn-helix (wHTH) protein
VTSEVLTARVWPNTNVSESNIRVHLAAIRKVFIDEDGETIVTIPGVGYRFALPVSVQKATIQQRAQSNEASITNIASIASSCRALQRTGSDTFLQRADYAVAVGNGA